MAPTPIIPTLFTGISGGYSPMYVSLFLLKYTWMFYNNGLLITEKIQPN